MLFQLPDTTGASGLGPPETWVAWAGFAETVATVIALAVGGWWTYRIFRQKRQKYPRANVTHSVQSWIVEANRCLIRVSVRIENVGDVLLRPSKGHAWLQNVRPWPNTVLDAARGRQELVGPNATEASWPVVKQLSWENKAIEIEPGEVDHLYLDFVASGDLETVMIYTHLENPVKQPRWRKSKGRQVGWTSSTVHELTHNQTPWPTTPTTANATAQNPPSTPDETTAPRRATTETPTSAMTGARPTLSQTIRAALRRTLARTRARAS